MNSTDNKRIAKNTGMLYFRLLLLTAVNLYTVNVTLRVLGVVDYGIYNTIASLVASLAVLNGAMTSATQRFLSFHLGKGDYEAYSRTYSLLIIGFMILVAAIMALGEGLGILFLDNWLKIPADRMSAARWVLQTSIAAFVLQLMTIPFAASIVANEKMSAFAMFSIVDGILKLGLVMLLLTIHSDRLILYGVLIAVETLVVLGLHIWYCRRNFKFCHFEWIWDRNLLKEVTSYTGWNLFGSVSGMLTTQGQNILLNIFFGPVINAAKAIGDRITNVVQGFSTNLYMAVSPQIIKSYAAGDMERTMSLVLKSSRFSFMLLTVMAFPLICNMNGVLGVWLGSASRSEDMVQFSSLMLLYCLIGCLEPPISRLIQATGQIRRYQITVGCFTILYIPVAALALWLGCSAVMTVVVLMVVMGLAMILRLYVAHNQTGLSYGRYFSEVIVPIIYVAVAETAGYLLSLQLPYGDSVWLTFAGLAMSMCYSIVVVWLFGLKRDDRRFLIDSIRKKLRARP